MKVRQKYFWFPDAHNSELRASIFVDGFAGGGGASVGIARAIGRSPDIAINHDRDAISMHMANHPDARHFCENIWDVDPAEACEGRDVVGAWFSPDCTHFSKARGAKPVKKKIRGLAWAVVRWAESVRPKVIFVENVEEFLTWGPVDRKTGQPIKAKAGSTFDLWVWKLHELGYDVDWRVLSASDYGAPTTRKRLFIVARCDGKPIVWPRPSHGSPKQIRDDLKRHGCSRRQTWRSAASIIDWDLPCPSIFDTAEQIKAKYGVHAVRPLAEKTLARIAEGIRRYVIETSEPFIVNTAHGSEHFRGQPLDRPLPTVTQRHGYAVVSPFLAALQQGGMTRSIEHPLHTICASPKDCNLLVSPSLVQIGYGERSGQSPRALDLQQPLGTVVAGGGKHALISSLLMSYYGPKGHDHHRGRGLGEPLPTQPTENRFALVSAFIAKHFGGMTGVPASRPFPTITSRGTQNQLVAATLIKNNHGEKQSFDAREPLRTVVSQGTHHAEVRAFLWRYYGSGANLWDIRKPAPTITVKDRLALGIVLVAGEPYQIVDIGMRMLTPRELFSAQGFPPDYKIDNGYDGRPASKSAQVARCGNSVCPDVVEALVRANFVTQSRPANLSR